MHRFWNCAILLAGLGCSSGTGSGSGGGASNEDCNFTVKIDSIACRTVKSTDPLVSDQWIIEVSGSASGQSSDTTSAELYLDADRSLNINATCASWSQYAAMTCLENQGQPKSTTWTGTIQDQSGSDTSHTYTVTATVKKTGSTYCQNTAQDVNTVVCTH